MGRHSIDEEPQPPSGRRVVTGRHPAVDAPVRGADEPGVRRPDGRMSTGQHFAVEAKAVMATPPRSPDRRVTTGRYSAVDAPARKVDPPPRRPDGRTTTGQHTTVDTPARQAEPGQRSDGRTATGYHRAVGAAAARRRIAMWPIVAGVLVLLLVIGLVGWAWANKVLDNRNAAQAKSCAEGVSTMKVIVAPGVARPVQAAATKWNQAKTVVHGHCVTVDVQPRPSDQVFSALTGRGTPDAIGGIPAVWIPEAPDNWATQLATARPDLIGSPPEGLTNGFSYVGLGGSAVDEVTVRAAQVFRDFLLDPAQRPGFTEAGLA